MIDFTKLRPMSPAMRGYAILMAVAFGGISGWIGYQAFSAGDYTKAGVNVLWISFSIYILYRVVQSVIQSRSDRTP